AAPVAAITSANARYLRPVETIRRLSRVTTRYSSTDASCSPSEAPSMKRSELRFICGQPFRDRLQSTRSRVVPALYNSRPREGRVILLGVILLIIGFVAKIAILWTIGVILLVIGVILAVLGMMGRAVGGRAHYY